MIFELVIMFREVGSMIFWTQDGVVVVLGEGDFDDGAVTGGRSGGDLVAELVAKGFRNVETHAG